MKAFPFFFLESFLGDYFMLKQTEALAELNTQLSETILLGLVLLWSS